MTAKLHEVLAVEKDLMNTSKRLIAESIRTFNKDNLFKGSKKVTNMFDANEDNKLAVNYADEHIKLETTVAENLNYSLAEVSRYWDAVLSKDLSNMQARADIVVDGTVIAKDVPATFLLGLESKLHDLANLFIAIPTLEPGRTWEADPSLGTGIYKDAHNREAFKTKKDKEFRSVARATEKHAEQIKELDVVSNIGLIVQTNWSGMISSAEKAAMIKRLVKITSAVKQARHRANATELVTGQIGSDILDYITND